MARRLILADTIFGLKQEEEEEEEDRQTGHNSNATIIQLSPDAGTAIQIAWKAQRCN